MTTTPPDPSDAALEQGLRAGRRLEDAPEAVIQRALGVWQGGARPAAPAAGALRRLVAAIAFDSGGAGALAFGRRAAGGATRQVLYTTEGLDIDLRISPDGDAATDRWALSGQVLGPNAQGVVGLADDSGRAIAEAPLSELGEFRLPAVGAGPYTLTLRLGFVEIVLPTVRVPGAG